MSTVGPDAILGGLRLDLLSVAIEVAAWHRRNDIPKKRMNTQEQQYLNNLDRYVGAVAQEAEMHKNLGGLGYGI